MGTAGWYSTLLVGTPDHCTPAIVGGARLVLLIGRRPGHFRALEFSGCFGQLGCVRGLFVLARRVPCLPRLAFGFRFWLQFLVGVTALWRCGVCHISSLGSSVGHAMCASVHTV